MPVVAGTSPICASRIGRPFSVASSVPHHSARSCTRSAIRHSSSCRAAGDVVRKLRNARTAAATARSTSPVEACETSAHCSPLLGSTAAKRSPASTSSPATKSGYGPLAAKLARVAITGDTGAGSSAQSLSRLDVLVDTEQVVRIEAALRRRQRIPQGRRERTAHALGTLLADEVEVRGAGRERRHGGEEVARPGHVALALLI